MSAQNQNQKQILRHEIMTTIKANNLEVTGDFWFMLIFRTLSELKKIAGGLNISVSKKN